jgi:hypothetical protein
MFAFLSSSACRRRGWTRWVFVGCLALFLTGCPSPSEKAISPSDPATEPDPVAKAACTCTLDEGQRGLLWDIEHHGNLLTRQGFKSLSDAIHRNDAQAVDQILGPDFTGQALQETSDVRLDTAFAKVMRKVQSGSSALPLDRAAFIDHLLSYRRLFAVPPKVQMSLIALAPADRENLDSPWQGACQMRIYGEMEAGKPGEVTLQCTFGSLRPSEENLSRGHWLNSCAVTQSQIGRSKQGYLFREVAGQRGIDTQRWHDNWLMPQKHTNTGGVYLCDFNRDGILDMLVTDITGYALYQGLPDGQFKEVTREVGLPRKLFSDSPLALSAAWADLDGDGWEDLLLGNRIYRNDQGKGFTNVTAKSNLKLPDDAIGVAIADYDRDGLVDLYAFRPGPPKAASWLEGTSGDTKGNSLFHNKGNWQFEDVTAASGTSAGTRSTFSAVWLDVNNDGWPDLYVINEFGNGVLLVNNQNGTFSEKMLVDGPGDFGSMGVTAGDIDNDGNIDLYIGNMYSKAGKRVIGNLKDGTYPPEIMDKMRHFVTGSQLHHNLGGLKFEQLGKKYQVASVGWAYGAALVDLDNDGFLDLVASCGFISQSRTDPDG